jgi:pimeloyl-ACP methyl ester carboxylesterase
LVFILNSCTKDTDSQEKSYSKLTDISIATATGLFNLMGQPDLASLVNYPIDIYSYTYPMDYRGNSIMASGLICVPVSQGESFPVLSFQHGTIVAHSEAPSVAYTNLQNMAIEAIAGMGYVVVLPDEIGFGESSEYFHPFLVKNDITSSIIEMLKAIKLIPDGDLSGVSLNDSLFLMGYSHGGWATMATLYELELNDESDWNIIATACGAGPYFPEQVMDFAFSTSNYSKPYYLSYVMMSFIDEGAISNELADFYNEPYASLLPDLYDGLKTGSQIDEQLTTVNADLYTLNYINNYPDGFPEVQQVVENNKTGVWNNKSPILLLHGENDIYIPPSISEDMYEEFMNMGSELVEYQVIKNGDHITAAAPAMASSVFWFNSFK